MKNSYNQILGGWIYNTLTLILQTLALCKEKGDGVS